MASKLKIILFLLIVLVSVDTSFAQHRRGKGKMRHARISKSKKTSYQILSKGFINIGKEKNKYFFEIPESILGRDLLLASRISEISSHKYLTAGYMQNNPILVSFEKEGDNIVLKHDFNDNVYSGQDQSKKSFLKNNLIPVIHVFKKPKKVKGFYKIDVTKFFLGELPLVCPFNKRSRPGKINNDISGIIKAEAFEKNIEIKVKYFYSGKKKNFASILNKSLVLLKKQPVKPRLADDRIGYFSNSKLDFYNKGMPSKKITFISRWNIMPKKEDIEKYKKGELVVPEKPIVFYIDNALPTQWYKYVKQGIEEWQKAFEKIGFKNAIVAKPFPKNKQFNPEDFRNNCFRYSTSKFANAQGLRWIDPRSGEILQGDVAWNQDVINTIIKWRFPQTAASDPKAWPPYSDEVIGEGIRYAVAHEIGHVLGLTHNFKASYAYSIKDLRSKKFTDQYGSTASIMDYARYNYVAQPKDGVTNFAPPQLGPYDYFAIKWGYTPLFENEKEILNKWLIESHKNPMLTFAKRRNGVGGDPSAQSGSVGNNDILASELGLKNLSRIVKQLVKKVQKPQENFDLLEKYYALVLKQYNTYLNNVLTYIGGVERLEVVEGDPLKRIKPTSKTKQIQALTFIYNSILNSESTVLNKDIKDRLENAQNNLMSINNKVFNALIEYNFYSTLVKNKIQYNSSMSLNEFFKEFNLLLLGKIKSNKKLTNIEQGLIYKYIMGLNKVMKENRVNDYTVFVKSAVMANKNSIKQLFSTYKPNKEEDQNFKLYITALLNK